MANQSISGVYNDALVAELHEQYRRDPTSVEESWRQFFRLAEGLRGESDTTRVAANLAYLRRVAGDRRGRGIAE